MKLEMMKHMSETHRPIQPLCVTFAPGIDGFLILSALIRYEEKLYVTFASGPILAHAILATQNWGRTERKLVINFRFSLLWKEKDFLQLVERGIESIKVACDSPLNALQSGKQKRRELAQERIAKGVLTPDLLHDFADWGLSVEHSLVEMHGLFTMWVVVKSDKHIAFSMCLDGWSGNIILSGGVLSSRSVLPTKPQRTSFARNLSSTLKLQQPKKAQNDPGKDRGVFYCKILEQFGV